MSLGGLVGGGDIGSPIIVSERGLRAGFLVLACGLLGILFTSIPGKIKRGLKEILAPKPVVITADETDLRRQIESLGGYDNTPMGIPCN